MDWIEIEKTENVPEGTMKLVKTKGKDITVTNIGGTFYAFSDRCPHMNSPLHLGVLKDNVVTCPLHYGTFDITTGKKLSEPKMDMPPEIMAKLPEDFLRMYSQMGEVMAKIETLDLKTYEVKVEGNHIFIRT
ncbi:MAG: Rieske (2Fe-2S) protein [Candidatus Heimdallarchaeota archaeon]